MTFLSNFKEDVAAVGYWYEMISCFPVMSIWVVSSQYGLIWVTSCDLAQHLTDAVLRFHRWIVINERKFHSACTHIGGQRQKWAARLYILSDLSFQAIPFGDCPLSPHHWRSQVDPPSACILSSLFRYGISPRLLHWSEWIVSSFPDISGFDSPPLSKHE